MRTTPFAVVFIAFAAFAALAAPARAASGADEAEAVQRAVGAKPLAAEALVPRGFVKAAEARGDLDGDGLDDVALLVHRRTGKKRDPAEDGLPQVVVIFRANRSGQYALWKVGGTHFIESIPDLMEENGVGIFEIKKGVLKIGTDTAMSAGGWQAGGCTEKWRNGPAGFQLIGLTVVDFSRACACGSSTDTNFVTGAEIYTTDRNEDGEQLKRERVTKRKGKPSTILWESFDYDKMCSSG